MLSELEGRINFDNVSGGEWCVCVCVYMRVARLKSLSWHVYTGFLMAFSRNHRKIEKSL